MLVHSDGGSYKPLDWMSPPCTVREGVSEDGQAEWLVTATKSDDTLRILIEEVLHDSSHDLGVDPGLQKDGVEKHLQELLAEHPATLADGLTLVRREFMTAIGPVDLMCRDADGLSVAVEIKRRGEIDGVEQLTRYLELLNRDPMLTSKGPVRGIYAAQEISPRPACSPPTVAWPAPSWTTTPSADRRRRAPAVLSRPDPWGPAGPLDQRPATTRRWSGRDTRGAGRTSADLVAPSHAPRASAGAPRPAGGRWTRPRSSTLSRRYPRT